MSMITVENLTKRYGAATVVDQVSLEVERNSITVIVAPPAPASRRCCG